MSNKRAATETPNSEEETLMGKHTMHKNADKIHTLTENMKEHRNMMMEFCMTSELIILNTQYRKRPYKNSNIQKTQRNARRNNRRNT